eukprot:Nk52_evm83s62 gene=Nk52_evmTU83s62
MRLLVWSCALCVVFVLASGCAVEALVEADAYRMLQYAWKNVKYGSWAAHLDSDMVAFNAQDLSDRCVIVHYDEVKKYSSLKKLSKMGPNSLLIVLPQETPSPTEKELEIYKRVESEIMEGFFDIPVYFVEGNSTIFKMYYKTTEKLINHRTNDLFLPLDAVLWDYTYRVITDDSPTTKLIKPLIQWNVKGIVRSGGSSTANKAKKYILIASHHDTFGMTPNLAYGASSNGSGTSVLLEIARLFSLLYKSSQEVVERARGKGKAPLGEGKDFGGYDLIFLSSGGGPINFEGLKHWYNSEDEDIISNIEFVIYLDSIAEGGMYMHTDDPDSKYAKRLFYDLTLLSANFIRFEHAAVKRGERIFKSKPEAGAIVSANQFFRENLPGVPCITFSNYKKEPTTFHEHLSLFSIFDKKPFIGTTHLNMKGKGIAIALSRIVFEEVLETMPIQTDLFEFAMLPENAEGETSKEYMFLPSMYDMLANYPRGVNIDFRPGEASHVDGILAVSSKVALRGSCFDTSTYCIFPQVLSNFTPDAKMSKFVVPEKKYKFYSTEPTTIQIFYIKPVVFDVYLFGSIAVSLIIFHHIFKALWKSGAMKAKTE